MLCLSVRILCNSVKFARSLKIIVGVCLAFGHRFKFAHHYLFNTVRQLGKTACGGLIVGDNQFIQGFLVYKSVKIVLYSYIFHNLLLFVFLFPYCTTENSKRQYEMG